MFKCANIHLFTEYEISDQISQNFLLTLDCSYLYFPLRLLMQLLEKQSSTSGMDVPEY